MQNEQVHKMQHEGQVIRRLVGNRAGYGLHHPSMGSTPLAVLYVALVDGLPPTIQVTTCGLLTLSPTWSHSPYGMGPTVASVKIPHMPSFTLFPFASPAPVDWAWETD